MNQSDKIRQNVSHSYTRAVEQNPGKEHPCCSGPIQKGNLSLLAGYRTEDLAALPVDAVANSFGCGNPVALAAIREGDTVLDLGSGAGIDILLAAKLTGPSGKVIGVDMTPAMIERARANAAAAGLNNIDVRKGIIEDLPIESNSIDLVISNCVINLSPEKQRVFSEIHRVLKSGGRISISDIVAESIPDWVRHLSMLYSACISGAIPETEYIAGLQQAGLVDVTVQDRLVYDKEQLIGLIDSELSGSCCCGTGGLPKEQVAQVAEALAGKIASIRVVAEKP